MPRKLDDPELGATYRGPSPPTREQLEGIPSADDLEEYIKYLRKEELRLYNLRSQLATELNSALSKCYGNNHTDPRTKGSGLIEWEVDKQCVICKLCRATYTKERAQKLFKYNHDAPVAQLDPERQATNLEAGGSNPSGRAYSKRYNFSRIYGQHVYGQEVNSEEVERRYNSVVQRISEMALQQQQVRRLPSPNRRNSSRPNNPRPSGYRGRRGN